MQKHTIAEKLQRLMKHRGLSPTELSRISGVPLTTILGISKGQRKNPGVDVIEKLSAGLRVSPVYFFSDRANKLDALDLPEDLKKLIIKEEFLPYLAMGEKAYNADIPHDILQRIIDSILEGRKKS